MSTDTQREGSDVSDLADIDEPAIAVMAERHRQETFRRACRRRETFEGRSTFRAWMYRIATNACLDLFAKRRPTPATVIAVQHLAPIRGPA